MPNPDGMLHGPESCQEGCTDRGPHLLQAMLLLGVAGGNSGSAEQAEAHAGLVDCVVPWGAADAKACRHPRPP